MTQTKKDGFLKRLFGGNKGGCCDVKIEEIKEDVSEEKMKSDSPSSCCTPDNKKTQ